MDKNKIFTEKTLNLIFYYKYIQDGLLLDVRDRHIPRVVIHTLITKTDGKFWEQIKPYKKAYIEMRKELGLPVEVEDEWDF